MKLEIGHVVRVGTCDCGDYRGLYLVADQEVCKWCAVGMV
jgi:hypothetical protein